MARLELTESEWITMVGKLIADRPPEVEAVAWLCDEVYVAVVPDPPVPVAS